MHPRMLELLITTQKQTIRREGVHFAIKKKD